MNRCGPSPAEQICNRETEIFQPAAVKEVEASVRQSRVNKCRSCVYQIAILSLTGAQLLLCPFTLSDFDHRAHELNELAGSIVDRMPHDMNVPDPFVGMNDS